MNKYKIQKFPASRIATLDVCETGKRKHHVAALIEVDVTLCREKIREHKRSGNKISFTSWLIKTIATTLKENECASAYYNGNQQLIVFNDINVSVLVEKRLNNTKVPIPLVIKKANEKSIIEITEEIKKAKNSEFSEQDIVLHQKSTRWEKIYYRLPGFIRRYFWRYLSKHPHLAFQKMGNVAITSIGMMGKVNGWFIPTSIHPVCFGISSITKKPWVTNDKVEIREILNMTILLDHDVIDGAQMARFIANLTSSIEKGTGL
jgi:pyruvate/2-oxoglutarate dehydrogenase complex dihydrolipoamide acyltransferase (E2) component